jgi:hypothetical protein
MARAANTVAMATICKRIAAILILEREKRNNINMPVSVNVLLID